MADKALVAIVEDDTAIRELVVAVLKGEGYATLAFASAELFHRDDAAKQADCLILDLMLPGQDGLSLCQQIARTAPRLPILIVTAKGDEIDRVIGLELGADDYLPKPFNARELLARLRAILRRTQGGGGAPAPSDPELFRFSGWTLSLGARELLDPDGNAVQLTTTEFDLLHVLLTYPQRVLSRDLLLDRTRGASSVASDRAIDVQLSRLRRKLRDDPRNPVMIRTVHGDGYLFTPTVLTR